MRENNNKATETEIRDIVYGEHYISFYESSNITGVKTGSFKVSSKKEKVIFNKDQTIVILDDGSKGVAICSHKDTFDKITGLRIAYNRAKINSLQKEIDKLSNYEI
jgi:hypothetical protein